MNKVLDNAIKFAVEKHYGQVDKLGKPYILHPLTVMLMFSDTDRRIVAVLHDTLEDTDASIEDLLDLGLTSEQVKAVIALTYEKGSPRKEYIEGIKRVGKLAVDVKSADILHNTSEDRLIHLDDETVGRLLNKYAQDLMVLFDHSPESLNCKKCGEKLDFTKHHNKHFALREAMKEAPLCGQCSINKYGAEIMRKEIENLRKANEKISKHSKD